MNKVSVHGSHSTEFCTHAKDQLEDIIQEYIRQEFDWFCITEHIPPPTTNLIYPDEKIQNLTCEKMYQRFQKYFQTAREYQKKYADQIKIYVGFEIEFYTNWENWINKLKTKFKPDVIVGSVHHIDNIPLDYDLNYYNQIIKQQGNIENVYLKYFDHQYELIQKIKPEIVGHFDLIRIFDPEYKIRWQNNKIWDKIERNLQLIKEYDLIMDYNLRALYKGADEPYISKKILERASELKIRVMPGDDSHEIVSVGFEMEKAIENLNKLGFNINFNYLTTF